MAEVIEQMFAPPPTSLLIHSCLSLGSLADAQGPRKKGCNHEKDNQHLRPSPSRLADV